MKEDKTSDTLDSEFNIEHIPISKGLLSAHQEGNYLVGITETGVRFSHRIPTDKMLSKDANGDWCFIPLRGSTS